MADPIPLTIEFTGGLEMLFSNQRKYHIHLPGQDAQGQAATVGFLIQWLCENVMRDGRREMFVLEDGVVRPGILVLINDSDWELEGEDKYEVRPGDCIVFMSTLHGG